MIYQPKTGQKLQRWEISLWEGCNFIVTEHLTKRGEPSFLENARSVKIGSLEKRAGHTLFGGSLAATANYGLFDIATSQHTLLRVSKVGGVVSVYKYVTSSDSWVLLTGKGTNLSSAECSFVTAVNRGFIVNGTDNNRYIEADLTTVVDSTTTTGMLYNSPTAKLVAFYKNRLYLGDYLNLDGTRNRTGICFSSVPLGIASLVSGDHTAPITTLNVTDTKYIKPSTANESLHVYRGGNYIGALTVTDKTATTLIINSFGTSLQSSDELWIAGTRSGEKKFRWDNRATGIDVHSYDNFQNTSEEDLVALENVNNNLLIFTNNSIAYGTALP